MTLSKRFTHAACLIALAFSLGSAAGAAEMETIKVPIAPGPCAPTWNSLGDQSLTGGSASTGSWDTYRTDALGTLKLTQPGTFTLAVKPKNYPEWKIIGLKSVTLTPVP